MQMHCNHRRHVWNIGLEQRNIYDVRRKRGGTPPKLNYAAQAKELTDARAQFDWLRAGSTVVQQQALRDLDQAFQNWWANPGHFRRPTFLKKGRSEGFYIRDISVAQINRKWATVYVPKAGALKVRLSYPMERLREATSARVTFKAGRWHVSFVVPRPKFERASTGAVVGIDRGVKNTLATSDGAMLHAPGWTGREQARFLALTRRQARQKKGSKRRAATVAQIADLHDRLARRRKDWIEQTTTRLARDYDLIALENLNTTAMVRRPTAKPDPEHPGAHLPNGARAKAALNKAIYASCWGTFATRLADKVGRAPTETRGDVVLVDPCNTSRLCRSCGHVAAENRQSQAVFACTACGYQAHADTNAAENILDRALHGLPEPEPGYAAGHVVKRTHQTAREGGSVKQRAAA